MRRRIIALAVAALAFPVSVLVAGEVLSRPVHGSVGPPPPDLKVTPVKLDLAANEYVAGWLVRGTPGAGVVLLLHGVRADRREMLGRAQFLSRLGYSILLIDLPAHGESTGARITFGATEAHGVTAALAYLAQEFTTERIGVIGASLGAAALVLSKPTVPLSCVVLESMFPTFREAVADRFNVYAGPLGEKLTPLLLWQMPLRIDVHADQLRPIVELPGLHVPLLIAAGSVDRYTTLPETERLYAAANEPKQLWIVDGAAHVDLHAYDRAAYEQKVSTFLAMYLRRAS